MDDLKQLKMRKAIDDIKKERLLEMGLFEEIPPNMRIDDAFATGFIRYKIQRPKSYFTSFAQAEEAGYSESYDGWEKDAIVRPYDLIDEEYLELMKFYTPYPKQSSIANIQEQVGTIRKIMWFWIIIFIIGIIIMLIAWLAIFSGEPEPPTYHYY